MKKLKAFRIQDAVTSDVTQLHTILDQYERHPLAFHLWANGSYKPDVSFAIAHIHHAVVLKFFVQEKEIRATITTINGRVWEDSCVEFFIGFDESGYYNLEFNCLGMMYAAFGKNRSDRKVLPEKTLGKIESLARFTRKNDQYYWELTIVVPTEVFRYNSVHSLAGMKCRGNFYKCGDGLSSPHFLSWTNIESDIPDFHLPEFFGEITFL